LNSSARLKENVEKIINEETNFYAKIWFRGLLSTL
jgi:hypothetical protein